MLVTLSLLVLASDVGTAVPAQADPGPRIAVYGYPSSTVAMAGYALSKNIGSLYGGFGVSVRVSGKTYLDVEAAAGTMNENSTGWLASFAVGPSLQLTGDEAFRGLFVAMHFRVEAFAPPALTIPGPETNDGPFNAGPGVARAFLAEVDVGYHFRFGRLYLAPIFGFRPGTPTTTSIRRPCASSRRSPARRAP